MLSLGTPSLMIPLRNQGYSTLPPERHQPQQEDNHELFQIEGYKKGGKVTSNKKGKKGTTATASATVHVHMAKRSYAKRPPTQRVAPMSGFPMNIQVTPPPNVSQGVPVGVRESELPQQIDSIRQNIDTLRRDFHLSQILLHQANSVSLPPTDGSRNLYPTNVIPPPQPVNHQVMGDTIRDANIALSRRINPTAFPFPSVSGASNSLEETQIQQGTATRSAEPASSGDNKQYVRSAELEELIQRTQRAKEAIKHGMERARQHHQSVLQSGQQPEIREQPMMIQPPYNPPGTLTALSPQFIPPPGTHFPWSGHKDF